jgi:hypothetical protein
MHFLQEDLIARSQPDPAHAFSAERVALAVEALRQSGRLRLQVRGESMLPGLWPGDELEIVACSIQQVRPGDIVLATREGRFYLHRFLSHCQPTGFFVRGDSMPTPDPIFPDEALLGRLAAPVSHNFLTLAVGRFLCYCGPARRLALKLHAIRKTALQRPARVRGDAACPVTRDTATSVSTGV